MESFWDGFFKGAERKTKDSPNIIDGWISDQEREQKALEEDSGAKGKMSKAHPGDLSGWRMIDGGSVL